MTMIPDSHMDLLGSKKAFANIATVMKDGSPQVTPVWFDYTDGKIRVNTARGRVKARTMREGAPVALAIMDPENPYRYLQIRGKVIKSTESGSYRFTRKKISGTRQISVSTAGRGSRALRD
jgi:PPOX class probable F420-dependent enzyme